MGERGASGYRVGSFRRIIGARVVSVLVYISVRALAPPRWSVGGRSENSASIEGFVNGRRKRITRHFRGLRDAVGTWSDSRVVVGLEERDCYARQVRRCYPRSAYSGVTGIGRSRRLCGCRGMVVIVRGYFLGRSTGVERVLSVHGDHASAAQS